MIEKSARQLKATQDQIERLRKGLENKPHPDAPPELVASTWAVIREMISEIEAEIEKQKLSE